MAYVPPATLDLGFLAALPDPGGWRADRVTHWHLTVTEIGTNVRERYAMERWHRIVSEEFVGTETDPRRALLWVTEQRARAIRRSSDPELYARRIGWDTRADFEFQAVCSWESLTRHGRTPAGGGVAVRDGWSVEIYATPMTAADCSRRHHDEASIDNR